MADKKIPTIIDCDPGHDDAMALILAAAEPCLHILGVTVTGGNQTVEKCAANALRVLSVVAPQVPVAVGAPQPLVRPMQTADFIHGEDGLAGTGFPQTNKRPDMRPAWKMMADLLEESPLPVTLIAIGALTNIAVLLLARPDLIPQIAQISLMGGSGNLGNFTPAAEQNIRVDPEAAHIVFSSGIPLIMCGLDVTHKAYITRQERQWLAQEKSPVAGYMHQLFEHLQVFHDKIGYKGCNMHDPVAVAAVVCPELFQGEPLHVDIEMQSGLCAGATVVDWDGRTAKPPNARVLHNLDRQAFVQWMWTGVHRYEQEASHE